MKNEPIALELPPEESIILEKKANKKKNGLSYLGGTIVLTNGALYFNPQKNTSSYDITRIPLTDVHVLKKGVSMGMIPNRIIVGDNQGTEHVFVVTNRNQFYEAIETQLSHKVSKD
ncbi:GRAM domain-containing protein [Marinilactibacillus sp. XAAS-LB27]|uniref:GRAM domain-containing protein n=1 Tax=Marinilactibacillus sp. XAAS-LB27 TaxID=3114538 RepID=UPI002E193AC3|nr:GRAM domain-containing protein [Marinilactibacillus sp. XAAS-LB27]